MKQNKLFPMVFLWMFAGLLVTALTSLFVVSNPNILLNVFGSSVYFILILLEFGLVIFLSARIHKMSYLTAATSFLLYALVTGITCAGILVVYQIGSIILMFGLTAFLFLIFGIIGYVTNLDLSKIGTILFIGLVGIILVGLVNFFLGNTILDMIICIVGIVIFLGLVMYDVNKIKAYLMDGDAPNKMAIYGALELYLDFINIFLYLLRLFGKSND